MKRITAARITRVIFSVVYIDIRCTYLGEYGQTICDAQES